MLSGTVERTNIYIYIYAIWSPNFIVFSEMVFLVLFCSRRTAYIVRDNAKKFISVGLSYKDVILFKKKYVFDVVLRKIK